MTAVVIIEVNEDIAPFVKLAGGIVRQRAELPRG
jgi:hypothetical protein